MKGNILVLTNNLFGLHSFRKEVMKAIVDKGYDLYISAPCDNDTVTFFEEIGLVFNCETSTTGSELLECCLSKPNT